jgi:mannose-6-phosphate isomerase
MMSATRLSTHRVEKPWGRCDLWPGFDDVGAGGDPVGEIWFQTPGDAEPELLVKYLFTSEKLSIQVHPDDARARASGYPRGKDEAWVILAAEPDSTIAMGLTRNVTSDELRAAALDGSIETLVDWKPVKAGDVIYSPAGTVHAIGAGLTLIEVQQNVDLTYRLYDYGRPRELHLDEGIAVSDTTPFTNPLAPRNLGAGRTLLVDGPKFVLERWAAGSHRTDTDGPGWFVPVAGSGTINGESWKAGECWLTEGAVEATINAGGDALFARPV